MESTIASHGKPLRVGTRGSDLALWQAREAARLLGVPYEIRVVVTSGDRILDKPLQSRLEKGFFTREIEEQLLSGQIDVAVHSLKDLPAEGPDGLTIAACLPRGPVSDLLLVHPDWHEPQAGFPARTGCRVAAGSLRRQALLQVFAPGCRPEPIRGNVPTRMHKTREGFFGALIVARAGIERLQADAAPLAAYELNPAVWLPAPGQGAIALQSKSDDRRTLEILARADDALTHQAVIIERRLLARFEAGCHTAFAAHAQSDNKRWRVGVGVESEGGGWLQGVLEGDSEFCASHGPEAVRGFARPVLRPGEWLCRAIQ